MLRDVVSSHFGRLARDAGARIVAA